MWWFFGPSKNDYFLLPYSPDELEGYNDAGLFGKAEVEWFARNIWHLANKAGYWFKFTEWQYSILTGDGLGFKLWMPYFVRVGYFEQIGKHYRPAAKFVEHLMNKTHYDPWCRIRH